MKTMEQYRITDRALNQAPGSAAEFNDACMAALLAMSNYARHPSDANEYELENALREIRRLRHVYHWRGQTH